MPTHQAAVMKKASSMAMLMEMPSASDPSTGTRHRTKGRQLPI